MSNEPEVNGLTNAGAVIRRVREECGITQAEFARELEWDPSRLNRVEKGTTPVTRKMIHEFALRLKIQPVKLLLLCLKEEYPALKRSNVSKELNNVIDLLS